MPGPLPKDSKIRQRTNKTSTAARLPAGTGRRSRHPKLPVEADRVWHPLTRKWWRDLWTSPMAGEYLQADTHGLFALADLVDRYWSTTDERKRLDLAKEVRLQRQAFGLTPIDRRRLQWEVDKVEDRKKRRVTRERKPEKFAADPRENLREVI